MKSIVIDARTLGARPTGIGLYAARQCARLMREHPECRFVLVTDVKESAVIAELEAKGAEIKVYGRRVFGSVGVFGYFRFLKRVIAEVKPDVFWQPNNLQPFRPAGVPRVIVTMHDVFGLGWSWRYAAWHLYYHFAFRATLKNVTEIWFNSKQTEREVRGAAPDLVAKLTCDVVYPITDVPPKDQIPDYPHERPYFLYLGNIEYRKGADLLCSAYLDLLTTGRADRPDPPQSWPVDLIFAGHEKNVRIPRHEGIITFGYVDEAMKLSLMKSCLALVVPSRAEGYGMQVAEAAAMGIRCIASDLPVFREIDPSNRVTFPVGDLAALTDALIAARA